MTKRWDIVKILKVMILLLPIVLLLSGCDSNTTDNQSDEALANQHAECFQGDILKMMYNTMGTMSMSLYTQISQGALTFTMVMFAVWFAFKIIAFVTSFKQPSSAEFWNQTLRQLFLCVVCGTLASSTGGLTWVLNYLIFPIFNAFLELGGQILSAVGAGPLKAKVWDFVVPLKGFVCTTDSVGVASSAFEASTSGFPTSAREMMYCLSCAISDRINIGLRIALKILGQFTLTTILVGVLLVLFLVFVKFAFVFYIIDAMFKFTMMAVLLPIIIIAYAFDFSRDKAKDAFKEMIAASVFMASIAVILATILLTLLEIVSDESLFGGNYWTNWFSPTIFCLLLVGFLLLNSMDLAQKLSSKLAGVQISFNVQKKLAAGASAVIGLVTTLITAGGAAPIAAKAKDAAIKSAVESVTESNKNAGEK